MCKQHCILLWKQAICFSLCAINVRRCDVKRFLIEPSPVRHLLFLSLVCGGGFWVGFRLWFFDVICIVQLLVCSLLLWLLLFLLTGKWNRVHEFWRWIIFGIRFISCLPPYRTPLSIKHKFSYMDTGSWWKRIKSLSCHFNKKDKYFRELHLVCWMCCNWDWILIYFCMRVARFSLTFLYLFFTMFLHCPYA